MRKKNFFFLLVLRMKNVPVHFHLFAKRKRIDFVGKQLRTTFADIYLPITVLILEIYTRFSAQEIELLRL